MAQAGQYGSPPASSGRPSPGASQETASSGTGWPQSWQGWDSMARRMTRRPDGTPGVV